MKNKFSIDVITYQNGMVVSCVYKDKRHMDFDFIYNKDTKKFHITIYDSYVKNTFAFSLSIDEIKILNSYLNNEIEYMNIPVFVNKFNDNERKIEIGIQYLGSIVIDNNNLTIFKLLLNYIIIEYKFLIR